MEELTELKAELLSLKTNQDNDRIEDEFGDVLFALVNFSRFIKVNPEDALRRTIEKFIFRFRKIEEFAKANNNKLEDMTLDEMDAVWNRVKNESK